MEPLLVLNRLLDRCRKNGAKGAEALLTESRGVEVRMERGRLAAPSNKESIEIKLRVYLEGGRGGSASWSAPRLADILEKAEKPLQRALRAAERAKPSPFVGPVERYDLEERGRGLLDRRHAHLDDASRSEILLQNATSCEAVDPALRADSLHYGELLLRRSFASTRGVAASETSTRFEASCSAHYGLRGRPFRHYIAARQFANVASVPFGAGLGQRLRILHQPASLPSAACPIIMHSSATADLLRALAPAFEARLVRAKKSFLRRHMNGPVANSRLHVIDDPSLPGSLHSKAFDDRGVPPMPVVLIREGSATGLLYDPKTAREAKLRPTGHTQADRAVFSNLVVRPGSRSRNAIGMELNDYLVIDGFHDEQPLDLATGMLDTSCDVLVFRGHQVQGGVLGLPLRLPITELLGAVSEVANDQSRYQSVDSCSLVLRGIELPSP